MYILDTDTLTLVAANHPRVAARSALVPSSEIAITIITKIEVLQGRFANVIKAANGAQVLRAVDKLLQAQNLLDATPTRTFDESSAIEFDQLRVIKGLRKIGRNDLLIASIARANRATLVTRNLRDFRKVPNLRVENWAD